MVKYLLKVNGRFSAMELKTVYFKNPGEENTDEVLRIARERAAEMSIKTAVVASVTGKTALKATEVLKGLRVVVVTHCDGHIAPNQQEFSKEARTTVESKGGLVLTVTPVFGGLSTAMRRKFKNHALGDIVSSTLRIFGDGMKEACEIVVTAADAGMVRTDEAVIAIAGPESGADTAIVCNPINATDFWDLRIGEILCKPRFR
jgi:hypothetical protein